MHDDRRRDVVWQIADDLHITGEIPQLPLLVDDPIEIGLQNILIDDLNVIVLCQSLPQDRDEFTVDLDSYDLRCLLSSLRRQHTDPRSDLDDQIFFARVCAFYDPFDHVFIRNKILSQALRELKPVFFLDCLDSRGGI